MTSAPPPFAAPAASAAAPTPPGGVAAYCVGLTKRYGSGPTAVTALDDVEVGFAQGQFTAIMGPSGSGKSTLMHCMAGLDEVTAGSVFIGDIELNALDDRRLTRLRRDRIGFIFQAYNLVPTLTALENITLPADIAGRAIDRAWLDAVIDTLGLRDRLRHRPTELSGGQQQRVACARALAGRPAIVFADEPTGNLDSRTSAEVLSFLRESVRRTGQTITMVTHDPGAAAYADRVLFLADGRIVDEMHEPTAERVLERMKAFESDVPHPEIVWAEPAAAPPPGPVARPAATFELPPVPVPLEVAPFEIPPATIPPTTIPPTTIPPTTISAPVAGTRVDPAPVPASFSAPAPSPAPLPAPVPEPEPADTAPAALNGHVAPDAVDMANWTDADWDAWLTRKQAEAESGPEA